MEPIHFPGRRFDLTVGWVDWLTQEERAHGSCGLYRFYSADQTLLYAGISQFMQVRWDVHRLKAAWWPEMTFVAVSFFPARCRSSRRQAELASIAHERPLYNRYNTNPPKGTASRLLSHVPPPAFGAMQP